MSQSRTEEALHTMAADWCKDHDELNARIAKLERANARLRKQLARRSALSLDEQAIERAARAAHESYERRVARLVPGVPEMPWERLPDEEVEQSLEDMRAAFAALRNDDEQEDGHGG